MLFIGLGGMLMGTVQAGCNASALQTKVRIASAATHGLGLLFLLLGGFGMLTRMGIVWPYPNWLLVKLVIWVLLAMGLSAAKKRARWALLVTLYFIALGAVASSMAVLKPF